MLPHIVIDRDSIVLPAAVGQGHQTQDSGLHQNVLLTPQTENLSFHEPLLEIYHLDENHQAKQTQSDGNPEEHKLEIQGATDDSLEQQFFEAKQVVDKSPVLVATTTTDGEEENLPSQQEATLASLDAPLRSIGSREETAAPELSSEPHARSSTGLSRAWCYGPKNIEYILRKQAFDNNSQPHELSADAAVATSPTNQLEFHEGASHLDIKVKHSESIASFASSLGSSYSDWSRKYDWPRFGDGSSRTSPVAESFLEHACSTSSEVRRLEIKSSYKEEAAETILAMEIANTRLENEIEDLKEDHSAKTSDLNDQISELTSRVEELRAASEAKDNKLREQKKNDYTKK